MGLTLTSPLPGSNVTVADALLAVHQSYVGAIGPVVGLIHGMAHITGGGIAGNLIRVLPETCSATIDAASWQWPPLFRAISDGGNVSLDEMRDVFNLGAGMIAAVPRGDVERVQSAARAAGVETWRCGVVGTGAHQVRFKD